MSQIRVHCFAQSTSSTQTFHKQHISDFRIKGYNNVSSWLEDLEGLEDGWDEDNGDDGGGEDVD